MKVKICVVPYSLTIESDKFLVDHDGTENLYGVKSVTQSTQ